MKTTPTNQMRKLLYLLLWFIPFTLSAQRYISGRITDAEDNEPVPAATVFISNTTIGTTTNAEGYYQLHIPGEGSYQLTVSHVAYQTVVKDIESGNTSVQFDAALHIHELEEVTVATRVRFRRTDINLFWRNILGKNPSRNTIQATNSEKVYYYYNSETHILKVTCREPLQIINYETGYHIQLILDHFTHDYNTALSSWHYEYMFSELEPANPRQKNNWEVKRREVYKVSLTNFIRALYHNTLMENGYLLTYPYSQQTDSLDNVLNAYEDPETFLSFDSIANCKMLRIPTDLKDLMLVCFGNPITQSDLNNVNQAQNRRYDWSDVGLFRNVLGTPDGPVYLFPDGTYKNFIHFSLRFNSNSLTGLNLILPLDYIPDVNSDTASAVSN